MSMLDSFLSDIVQSLRSKNGRRIAELIQLDFESLTEDQRKPYANLNGQLNSLYPRGKDSGLVSHCKQSLSQDEFGSFSSSFSDSVVHYFRYLRDFATADNLAKALEIRQLTSQCITALGDSRYGVVMIPIVLSFSRTLAAVATNLDRNQSLLQQSNLPIPSADDSTPSKVTFVEDAANVLRDAFIKCLAGSPGVQRTTRPSPDDKRIGIYLTANSTLKLLFQCRKLRNAQQMFLSIDAQSPPLSYYPAAQRITYLYYLGRYHFANSHFHRATLVLQAAYDQCHAQALSHRRLILLYLIASNICLGRFPSSKLLMRREASSSPTPHSPNDTLAKHFLPLCKIIKSGDLGAFHSYLSLSPSSTSTAAQFFLRKRMLLQLQNRCEILVWRSLIRKTFIYAGFKGEEKKIPFLRVGIVRNAAWWCLTRHRRPASATVAAVDGEEEYKDPDFANVDEAITETGFDVDTGTYNDDDEGIADQHQARLQQRSQDEQSPTLAETESVFFALIQQSLLRGFMLHTNPRFAIPGSKAAGGAVNAGFPGVYAAISAREGWTTTVEEVVPGCVTVEALTGGSGMSAGGAGGGGSMAGRVVRLSGARAVGVGS